MPKIKKYLTKTDKAFKRVSKEYAMKQAEKHKERAWLKEHRQSVINTLPKRTAANFESYDFTDIKPQKVQSLFLTGEAHTGKTVLSAYYYVNFVHDLYIQRGYFPKLTFNFVIFPNFIEIMQKLPLGKMLYDYDKTKDLQQLYCTCDILVLDDFGGKKVTDYVYSLMYSVINDRYLNMLPTIINSNHTLTELGEMFEDDRIIRRIEEDYILINKTTFKK